MFQRDFLCCGVTYEQTELEERERRVGFMLDEKVPSLSYNFIVTTGVGRGKKHGKGRAPIHPLDFAERTKAQIA
jgi:hypothetical protein